MKRKLFVVFLAILLCLLAPALAEEAGPAFSHKSGFYPQGFELTLTAQKGAAIYYTLDGSAPDEYCDLYEAPIFLGMTVGKEDPLSQITGVNIEENYIPMGDFPSAHVLRARALLPDGTWSKESCGTFFVGYERKALYGDLPIISLIMDARDLFDQEYGIYVLGDVFVEWNKKQTQPYDAWNVVANYTGRGREWEREVMVDFLMSEKETFSQFMGVRIKGGASRGATQKSLRLIARADYGEKNIKYPLFPQSTAENGKTIRKYKTVTLRNGGNDRDFARIRDPFIANLSAGLCMETAQNRPVIAFINGEFWGLYTLNEEMDDHYIETHYGIDNNNVVTFKVNEVEDGEFEDGDLYWGMYYFITCYDMKNPENYAKAATLLDMQSFADFIALQLYIYSKDSIFDNNNWQMWRVRDAALSDHPLADGKWRMMLYDTDFSSGVYESGNNYKENNLKYSLSKTYAADHPGRLVTALMQNPDFQGLLVNSLCDIRSLCFTSRRTAAMLQSMQDEYLPYMPDTFRRVGPDWVARWDPDRHIRTNMSAITTFFSGRNSQLPSLMKSTLKLKNVATITVRTSGKGQVLINNRPLPIEGSQKVFYFPDYPITITAVPEEGSHFTSWQVNNKSASVDDAAALTTTLHFKDTFTLTALFE